MSLIVFDMGQRIETPSRPISRRVKASSASAATSAINSETQPNDASHHSSQAQQYQKNAINAYQEQQERHPAVVSFIKDILHRDVRVLSPKASLEQAWQILQDTGYHHLPIVDEDNNVLAIFSDGDLLRPLSKQGPEELKKFWQTPAMHYASRPVYCVQEHTDIHQSSKLLYEYNIGALPVLSNNNTLCGIVTRSDIMRLLSHYGPLEMWV